MNQELKLSKFCSSKYPLANTEVRTTHFTGKEDQPQLCGEYWFLVPDADSVLDNKRPDHQVLLLVDKEEYDTNSEVIVYVPTSHVLVHDADMLSVQLLTYFT